jgi:hypothetical protein
MTEGLYAVLVPSSALSDGSRDLRQGGSAMLRDQDTAAPQTSSPAGPHLLQRQTSATSASSCRTLSPAPSTFLGCRATTLCAGQLGDAASGHSSALVQGPSQSGVQTEADTLLATTVSREYQALPSPGCSSLSSMAFEEGAVEAANEGNAEQGPLDADRRSVSVQAAASGATEPMAWFRNSLAGHGSPEHTAVTDQLASPTADAGEGQAAVPQHGSETARVVQLVGMSDAADRREGARASLAEECVPDVRNMQCIRKAAPHPAGNSSQLSSPVTSMTGSLPGSHDLTGDIHAGKSGCEWHGSLVDQVSAMAASPPAGEAPERPEQWPETIEERSQPSAGDGGLCLGSEAGADDAAPGEQARCDSHGAGHGHPHHSVVHTRLSLTDLLAGTATCSGRSQGTGSAQRPGARHSSRVASGGDQARREVCLRDAVLRGCSRQSAHKQLAQVKASLSQ